MELLLQEILDELRKLEPAECLDDKLLAKIIHKHNKGLKKDKPHYSKKRLLPYYLKVKDSDWVRWKSWNIDPPLEQQLVQSLRVKPRRTASGVATITVITKPWKCSNNCLYCPNDLRMPKSYLSDEPACQRAERNYFDPYLQVASRLRALTHMGHATDKIELIVLGGTWSDYPQTYQLWFVTELFRALNDEAVLETTAKNRRTLYRRFGLSNKEEELAGFVSEKQEKIDRDLLTYNQAMTQLYEESMSWKNVAKEQVANFEQLFEQHRLNETAQHRVVGLAIETRPDTITLSNLTLLRQLGCTKIQIGIQSLDPQILKANKRTMNVEKIAEAFALLRVFGFKIHAHFMVNLYESTPEKDKRDYQLFVTDKHYLPDEVKLYPCALVKGTGLCKYYADGRWQPYTESELIDVLITDTLATPPYVRISRMIRDISAHDILVGNKKTNLRQLVEQGIEKFGETIKEIRYREISTLETTVEELRLKTLSYETKVSAEYFLQWVTSDYKIAGFLRLSLPRPEYLAQQQTLPINAQEAMIREVHVYGKVAKLKDEAITKNEGTQHLGLGKQLIEAACDIAKKEGYTKVNVISSVGTREYYRSLGFFDKELYQQKGL